jgi:alpha-ketoglutaric semialdehyde dehydrogenase
VRHPHARAVGFTGSVAAGRALFDAAASRPTPIPVFAEMSSLNPLFILPGALRERASKIAEGLRTSVTMGVGQFCTKPGLVFGLGGDAFTEFQHTLGGLLGGVAPATMLHGGIRDSYEKGMQKASHVSGVSVLARSQDHPNPSKTQGQAVVAHTTLANFEKHHDLAEEVFGPFALLISAPDMADLEKAAEALEGQLTATLHATPDDLAHASKLLAILERKVGRLVINGYPTGVEVCPSMNHGGPYPATTDVRFTSVGTAALYRFVRPICYQDFPASLLPASLRDDNPLGIRRMVNGELQ